MFFCSKTHALPQLLLSHISFVSLSYRLIYILYSLVLYFVFVYKLLYCCVLLFLFLLKIELVFLYFVRSVYCINVYKNVRVSLFKNMYKHSYVFLKTYYIYIHIHAEKHHGWAWLLQLLCVLCNNILF